MADERFHLKNILTGDVCLASGQSNMVWTIGGGVCGKAQETANANHDLIRFFKVPSSVAARYAFVDNPVANLYNAANLAGSADTHKFAASGSRTTFRDTSGRSTGSETTIGCTSGSATATRRDASGRVMGNSTGTGRCQGVVRVPVLATSS